MRIVIIGPPDSGKRKLAKKLAKKYPNLSITNPPELLYKSIFKEEKLTPALGILSDYRSELLLASYRSCDMIKNDNRIFTHSILDNILYTMAIVAMKISNNTIDERWAECVKWFPFMAADSFTADVVIRFTKNYEDNELLSMFDENIEFLLQTYHPDYLESRDLQGIYNKIDSILERENV